MATDHASAPQPVDQQSEKQASEAQPSSNEHFEDEHKGDEQREDSHYEDVTYDEEYFEGVFEDEVFDDNQDVFPDSDHSTFSGDGQEIFGALVTRAILDERYVILQSYKANDSFADSSKSRCSV